MSNANVQRASKQIEGIWQELHAELHNFIRRRVSDDAIADDLLQEVFLRIHDRVDSLMDAESLHAWVYRIARNTITDYFRQQKQHTAVALDREPVSDELNAENLNAEVARWLAEMTDQLPETYREAVRLSELNGVPQKQVAEQLGLSVSGAKSRIQRGRQMLKESLLRCCHLEIDRRGNVVDCTRRDSCAGCCTETHDCTETQSREMNNDSAEVRHD